MQLLSLKQSFSRAGFFVLVSLFSLSASAAIAQTSSTNFNITSDSLNCGGGRTSSASFSIDGSLCETASMPPVGGIALPSSTNFNVEQGFPAMDDVPFISVSLLDPSSPTTTKNSINFGTLTNGGGVKSDSLLVRVSTNAANGYAATIFSDGTLRSGSTAIADVADGTVDGSPSGEYGFTTSGTDGQYNSTDTSVTTASKTFAQKSTWASQSDTTLTFKAAVASDNTSGTYSQSLTVVVTGSF